MTLDLTCQACDSSFELDAAELLDEPRIQCPSCDARVPLAASEGLSSALEDLCREVARLQAKFSLVLEVDSDDLPPPFDRGHTASSAGDEEDDEDDLERERGRDDED